MLPPIAKLFGGTVRVVKAIRQTQTHPDGGPLAVSLRSSGFLVQPEGLATLCFPSSLSNNALECSIMIRVALAIKLAELAIARKNNCSTDYSNDICRIRHYVQKIVHSHKPGKHGPAIDQAAQ